MYATQYLSEDGALEADDLPDSDILTGACGGLIIVYSDSGTVRAVHYTAQSYFKRSHAENLVNSRVALPRVSLAYLTLDSSTAKSRKRQRQKPLRMRQTGRRLKWQMSIFRRSSRA
ncbi:hypothetical protein BDV06DRAFT_191773 [Aspergillus oleicola]